MTKVEALRMTKTALRMMRVEALRMTRKPEALVPSHPSTKPVLSAVEGLRMTKPSTHDDKDCGQDDEVGGRTAVASISTLAPSSSRSATCTSAIAGKCAPTISRYAFPRAATLSRYSCLSVTYQVSRTRSAGSPPAARSTVTTLRNACPACSRKSSPTSLLALVPADLTGDGEEAAFGHDAVRVPAGPRPALGFDLQAHRQAFLTRSRCSLLRASAR